MMQALIESRSRRFPPGMKLDGGPLSFESKREPKPLTEDEEAALGIDDAGRGFLGTPGFANPEQFRWMRGDVKTRENSQEVVMTQMNRPLRHLAYGFDK
jgi:hypothetical protein